MSALLVAGACLSFVVGVICFLFEYEIWNWVHCYFGFPQPERKTYFPLTPLQMVLRALSGIFMFPAGVILWFWLFSKIMSENVAPLMFLAWLVSVALALLFGIMFATSLVSLKRQIRHREFPL